MYWLEMRRAHNALRQKYEQLAIDLADISNQVIRNRNPGSLFYVLRTEIEEQATFDELEFLRIIGGNGKIYFSMLQSEEGQPTSYDNDKSLFEKFTASPTAEPLSNIDRQATSILDISMPFENEFGKFYLRIGFKFTINVRLDFGNLSILFITLITLSIIFLFVLNRIIVAPIEQLTFNSRLIAHGQSDDFSYSNTRSDEIGRLARSLHDLVKQLKLKQQELAEKEKLAVLGKGTGRLTHNISNLLNPLNHYFQVVRDGLKKRAISSSVKESLDTIEKHVDLIKNDLNRLRKAIPDQPRRERYPVSVLVDAALSQLLKPESIQIKKQFGANHVEAQVDPEQMTMAFCNIIQNAFQAIEPDGGELSILIEKHRSEVWIRFVDSGCGIPQEKLKEIFQFFTTTKKNGMGIGLSSSLEIVRNHGGTISVESTPGSGSTFTVKLPL